MKALMGAWAEARNKRQGAQALYVALVARARDPYLYTECAIPDTLDGRFDAIVLHLFLVSRRLRSEERGERFLQLLQEAFISDMDRSLRELGVGDTGVGKRIQKMASALLGRAAAYEASFDNEEAFAQALSRNVYRSETPNAPCALLVAYARRFAGGLSAMRASELMSGQIRA